MYHSVRRDAEDEALLPKRSLFSNRGLLIAVIGLQIALVALIFRSQSSSQGLVAEPAKFAQVSAFSSAVERLPVKLEVPYVTPRANQAFRGTCWDFATIALLEWSYRANGIKHGWLKPEEYVKLSEQAYGVVVLERCQQFPKFCVVPNDAVWLNSTDGGEIPFLYSLPNLDNAIVPEQVCQYAPTEGHDFECANLTQALKANPLKFHIKSMTTLYQISDIKEHLVRNGRVLGFSSAMTSVNYYYPCTGKWALDPGCAPVNGNCKTFCPLGRFPAGTCCLASKQANYNAEAEFFSHGDTDFEDGGLAMLLVGYNDDYVTQSGDVGGFILKNNWYTNATHSVEYFMQSISRWDENVICPNSMNPRNWYTCDTLEKCLSERTSIYANVSFQPLELKCVNRAHCKVGDEITYFIKNYTHVGDDMHVLCLFKYNSEENEGAEVCLDPLVLDTITTYLRPRTALKNDPDRCGFYFWPYKLIQTWWGRFHNSYCSDFDIEWDPQSYVANKAQYPELDYSWLEASTKTQREYKFSGPIPYEYLAEPDKHAKKKRDLLR